MRQEIKRLIFPLIVFSQKDMISNIQPTEDTLTLDTYGRILTTHIKCDIAQ
jgi:hypothetical protein